jgi:hypothetical protein
MEKFVSALDFFSDDQEIYFKLIDFCASVVLSGREKGIVVPAKIGFPLALAEASINMGIPVMLVHGEESLTPESLDFFWYSRYKYVLENSAQKKFVEDPKFWILDYLHNESGLLYSMWDGEKGNDALTIRTSERLGLKVVNFWNDFRRCI